MERRQGWMTEFLINQGEPPLDFVRSAHINDSVREVAARMRQTLGLTTDWAARRGTWGDALKDLRSAIENVGILVVVNGIVGNNTHRRLDVNEFRGFVLVNEYAPLVFINGADGRAAQMFTLAHELAHIWFGVSAAFDLKQLLPAHNETEKACNVVAAEFLVPENDLRIAWSSVQSESDPFQSLARKFKVSTVVAARRALDAGLISRNRFFEFYEAYENDERREIVRQEGGGDFYASQNYRIGRRFAEAVIRAVKEGHLLYHEAYQLTGLSGDTFGRYAESLGFEARRSQ
jgi:Zn-dependent peptidase ImmA (M78 family)